jgi:[FeFe] hydrogenase H-cluster maturation GTPase HydF
MRLQIVIFGRTNVGKSSVLNMLAGQDVSITSPIPGTTTDVVEKAMELLPVGPVVFLDTGGLDDSSALGCLRTARTKKAFDRADIAVLVIEAEIWGDCEDEVVRMAGKKGIPVLPLVNKTDIVRPSGDFLAEVQRSAGKPLLCSAVDRSGRDAFVAEFKARMMSALNVAGGAPAGILGDLVLPGETAVLIVPIDKEAPKGRIILPQVQTIRDLLDNGAMSLTVRELEYARALKALSRKPALVICDSQVVDLMVAQTPGDIPCTTFSILFARLKGALAIFAAGAAAVRGLKPGDSVLVAEGCSHHPIEDDIGRIKLPKWLADTAGGPLKIDTVAGRDFPETLSGYKLVIQCGGCMLTRKEVLNRMEKAEAAGIPITNYGLAISECKGVLRRVLSPFREALAAYEKAEKLF